MSHEEIARPDDPEWPTIRAVANKVNRGGPLLPYCEWIMETRGHAEGDRIWRAGCRLAEKMAPPKAPEPPRRRRWWQR